MSVLSGRRALPRPQNLAVTDQEYDEHVDRLVAGMRPCDPEEAAEMRRLLVPARVTGQTR